MKIELLDFSVRASLSNMTDMQSFNEYEDLIMGLSMSGIDNIELGYLSDDKNGFCRPCVNSIKDYYNVINDNRASYSVMVHPSGYDCRKLPYNNGKVTAIRLLLQKNSLDEKLKMAELVKVKGYDLICDIDEIYSYSDMEILNLCQKLCLLKANQVTIVDTTNNLDTIPLRRVGLLLDNNLDENIKIGLRTGENVGVSQNTATMFLEEHFKLDRTIVIECTLLGMGMVKGNVCTEVMADYLNVEKGFSYDYDRLITLISLFIPKSNLKPNYGGYHPAYYISAKNKVDGEYARYFLDAGIPLYMLNEMLKKVSETEQFQLFDEVKADSFVEKFKGDL